MQIHSTSRSNLWSEQEHALISAVYKDPFQVGTSQKSQHLYQDGDTKALHKLEGESKGKTDPAEPGS